jgi:aminomethyltransferase
MSSQTMDSPKTGKRTPLFKNHQRRGAKIVDFSGWDMPLQYSKVLEEHHAVRNAAGLFDISHMALVVVKSQDGNLETVRRFLNSLVPQDLTKLVPGKAVYTQFLNENGGILDDIIIYQLPEACSLDRFSQFLVICNAGNADLDLGWMNQHKPQGIDIDFVSDAYALFALQGPKFSAVLNRFSVTQDSLPKRFHVGEFQMNNTPVLLARTGYTGEDGVEIIVPVKQAEALWDALLTHGEQDGLKPIGLAARDTLRLEAAYPLHGHDISDKDTPLEAGLGWSVKLNQEADFIGKAALLKQKESGLSREFFCLKLKKKTIARQHDAILKNGETVGEVTSGSISPLWNEPIAMGYIKRGVVTGMGDLVQVQVRGSLVDAELVERPFYKVR